MPEEFILVGTEAREAVNILENLMKIDSAESCGGFFMEIISRQAS